MKKAIIFDYNGVLANDEEIQQEAFRLVLKKLGVDLTDEIYSEHFLGRTDLDGFRALRDHGIELNRDLEELTKQKSQTYGELVTNHNVLYPGVVELLAELHKTYRVGIATSSSAIEINSVLKKNNLTKYIDALITADDISKGKPDPEGYLKCLALLNTSAKCAVAIEDSPSGILAAKNASMACIAVLQTTEKDKLANSDLIIEKVGNLDADVIEKALSSCN